MTPRQLLGFGLVIAIALAIGAVLAVSQIRGQDLPLPLTGPGPYRGSEPPSGLRLPAFSLRDALSGERYETQALRGRIVLVTFLDTDCTHQCPIIAAEMGKALRLLPVEVRTTTTPLVISVNPLIDTPSNVTRFLRKQRARDLTYLTGSITELEPVWRRFAIVSAYETGDADTHSADVRIFDPNGIWVSTQHVGADLSPENLAYDIKEAAEA